MDYQYSEGAWKTLAIPLYCSVILANTGHPQNCTKNLIVTIKKIHKMSFKCILLHQ